MKRLTRSTEGGIYIDQVYSHLGQCLLFELQKEESKGLFSQKIFTNEEQHVFQGSLNTGKTNNMKTLDEIKRSHFGETFGKDVNWVDR